MRIIKKYKSQEEYLGHHNARCLRYSNLVWKNDFPNHSSNVFRAWNDFPNHSSNMFRAWNDFPNHSSNMFRACNTSMKYSVEVIRKVIKSFFTNEMIQKVIKSFFINGMIPPKKLFYISYRGRGLLDR